MSTAEDAAKETIFPRSFERGPIEADLIYSYILHILLFPRSFERGPIEASPDLVNRTHAEQFPRSFERGPIEASMQIVILCRNTWNFHVHLNVAPLKLTPSRRVPPGQRIFPRSFERGPIEASPHPLSAQRVVTFPRSFERGPIEAFNTNTNLPKLYVFPRSFERGPIEAYTIEEPRLDWAHFHVHLNVAPLKHLSPEFSGSSIPISTFI